MHAHLKRAGSAGALLSLVVATFLLVPVAAGVHSDERFAALAASDTTPSTAQAVQAGNGAKVSAATSALAITTTSVGPGNVGTYFAEFLTANGGLGTPYRWSLVDGTLPSGLSMPSFYGVQSTVISGTPTTAETTTFTVQVRDGSGNTAAQSFSLTINLPNALVITNQSSILMPGTVGAAYAAQLFANGGVQPYRWTLVSAQLPLGLTLAGSGRISGTPTTAGASTFTVAVSDSAGAQVTGEFSIAINP